MNLHVSTVLFDLASAGVAHSTLIDTAAKGCVLFVIAALLTLGLRRASAEARHLVWISALGCALVLPICSSYLPQWRALPTWMSWDEAPGRLAPATLMPKAIPPAAPALAPVPSFADQGVAQEAHEQAWRGSISPRTLPEFRTRRSIPTILLIWGIGGILLLTPLIFSIISLRRIASRAQLISDGPLLEAMRALQGELGIRRKVRLQLGEDCAMPIVWGIFRPQIVLPGAAASWTSSRLRGVLLHELGHVRRRDAFSMLIAHLALAVHWFNPLAWLAVRQVRLEQERACDDLVLRHGVRPSDYASDLLAVATTLRGLPFSSAALSMANRARLEGRIAGILDHARNRRALTGRIAAIAVAAAAIVALPLAMLRTADAQKAAPEMEPFIVAEKRAAGHTGLTGVSVTRDAAEILVEAKEGNLALVVGDGAKVMVHRFGSSRAPIILRIDADDRRGKWWDQVRITRAGESDALFPDLPDDWLPSGRVVFLPESTETSDGGVVIAEIENVAGKVPLVVRSADLQEVNKAAAREIPTTCPDTRLVLDVRIHALEKYSPEKSVILPVMAAQDLVGSPRTALALPYMTVSPGMAQKRDRMNRRAEQIEIVTALSPGGVQVEGSISLSFIDGNYESAKEAWQRNEAAGLRDDNSQLPGRRIRSDFSATLGGNDALIVPIASDGLFSETLVAFLTALPRRESRLRWLPVGSRSPIQVDGWVLTWPGSRHGWFSSLFDYNGVPRMISRQLEARKNPPANGYSSESIGSLQQSEVDKLVQTFRETPGVSVNRVEPFEVQQHTESFSTPEDRSSFSAAGEGGTLLMHADGRYITPDLRWDRPVLKHASGGGGYGIYSGTSFCVLLPGPADPEEIRMLLLRCVDPDGKAVSALEPAR